MDNKTKRIDSKTGVNPAAMREVKAARARGLKRKMDMTPLKKKAAAPKPRATRVGTPVPMPQRPGKGPVARMAERTTMSKPKPKVTKKPSKPVTERQLLDVKNMTPAEKMAYLKRGKRGF